MSVLMIQFQEAAYTDTKQLTVAGRCDINRTASLESRQVHGRTSIDNKRQTSFVKLGNSKKQSQTWLSVVSATDHSRLKMLFANI
ncbi:MAG: hypothetical protein QOG10_7150 [Kribbellaceae bacterium]|nr:hypothetical protein [Kribbellaceae bacterium]